MATDDDRQGIYQSSPPTPWGQTPHIYPHSHHGTPAQEYSGFNFGTPQLAMEPGAFNSALQQRPMVQPLQPLVMPQWPSMLNSQSHLSYQAVFPQPVQPIQPMSIGQLQTPISATSTRSASTPRKTLTDSDRKRMCQYAEDHPNSKQTEIGAIFGVERSTVSKVLRQKEKYLLQDDGSRSPVKRAKGRSPDIERALAVWAKNQEKKGARLTDEIIRDQARVFAATTTSPENQQALSSSWIEKFKHKNNLMGARSRKSSLAPDDAEGISATASSSHSPTGTSPISTQGVGSPELHSAQSQESLKGESPDNFTGFGRHNTLHSHSTTSLNSAFTDTGPSSFSPDALSASSSSARFSPLLFKTPDSGTRSNAWQEEPPMTAFVFVPPNMAANNQRPRSQTVPVVSTNSGVESTTTKYTTTEGLDSPMEEAPDPLLSMDEAVYAQQFAERPHTVVPSDTMRPPPLPFHILANEVKRESAPAPSTTAAAGSTSAEQAREALETLMNFIQQQPSGFLDFQESMHMGKLMEKLKLQSRTSS